MQMVMLSALWLLLLSGLGVVRCQPSQLPAESYRESDSGWYAFVGMRCVLGLPHLAGSPPIGGQRHRLPLTHGQCLS
jgi:hypothetical protein